MFDVITIGSAMVDLFMKSPQFHLRKTEEGILLCQEYGGKMDIDAFHYRSGGAGTNTAVGFARMGLRTAAVAEIGQDLFAQVVWDDLKRDHVATDFLVAEKKEETAVSVLLISADGGRSALTHRGAAAMLEPRDIPWHALEQTRWIHLSNVGGNVELLQSLFSHLQGKMTGLSWNPGKSELQLLTENKLAVDMLPCDILCVNREEWALVAQLQRVILQVVPTVIVTNGREGGDVYIRGEAPQHYVAQSTQTVQETGAGDAFITGFVGAHLFGCAPMQCAQWGLKNAASVVQHFDAKEGLLHRKDFGL